MIFGGCSFSKYTPSSVTETYNQKDEYIHAHVDPQYALGSGDIIDINVWREDDLNRRILINQSGEISYPFVGNIQINGMSMFQLKDIITETLSEYFINPQVTVNIVTSQSKKIFVLGEVRQPGMFNMFGPTTAIEAVSMASGFTRDAKKKNVLLVRGGLNDPDLKSLNLKAALKKGDITQNLALQPGDVLYVPTVAFASTERFFNRINSIIRPIINMEYGLAIWPQVEDTLNISGREGSRSTTQIQLIP
ncbi:periplasmic protein [Candidatus Scalindua japonica]|uniref:Periplasmic protein n=1 Tax=Candidatus Scalindua japonica TaxID=1284222 RepID=A0A286TWZ2_9BACT|nr:periplasmic protein [Candidatus Scalindua japonica]